LTALIGLIVYYIGENNWMALSFLALYFFLIFIVNSVNHYYSRRNGH